MVSDEPTEGRCNAPAGNGKSGYCESYPVTGEEKCRMHLGKSADGSSHENNQNAQTHGLFADHDGYYHDLDDEAQGWVFDFTNDLLDRYRREHGRAPDRFDKEALKNIAIDFHRVANANSWFSDAGLIHTETKVQDGIPTEEKKINVWAGEIRQYNTSIYRRMKDHGLLNDPESQKADAVGELTVEINRNRVTADDV